jgi:orotidine-5'-phosphate decarboxylase
MDPRERLIVALDVPASEVRDLVVRLNAISTFKVGVAGFCEGGTDLIEWIQALGHRVFLDLKLHDIPSTVERATAALAGLGIRFLTVHAAGGGEMVAAAVGAAARRAPELEILAVTVLTSLAGDAFGAVFGPAESPEARVLKLARLARSAGSHGIVASAREAAVLRAALDPHVRLVCPGIRPAGADRGDQQRTVTPREAIQAGADYLVVGRPITGARDPAAAAASILDDIRTAASGR